MVVFAQLSTSVSDDQIRLIILALLGIAFLLAVLTTWYFVRTSPRRRVRAAQARRSAPNGRVAAAPGSAADPSTVAPASDAVLDTFDDALDEDDEWTRLTAPEQQRPMNG